MLHLVEMDTDPIDLHVNISLNKENPCFYFFSTPSQNDCNMLQLHIQGLIMLTSA